MAENESCKSDCAEECCSLEAVVTIDERGQFVLPKDLRTRAGIEPGDRLAIVAYPKSGGGICCITLVKADTVATAVQDVIRPAIGQTRPEKE
ncbi:MAG: HgcAB-associated protein [Coriobacteriia bacterium]|nr:HgcAB-associated protein [Coriobacteriia bacterium]